MTAIIRGASIRSSSLNGAPPPTSRLALPGDVLGSGLISSQTFFDDFTSTATIDLTNTLAPGYKWYVANAWPNAASPWGSWVGINTALAPTPQSSISQSGSILTLNNAPNLPGLMLQTAAFTSGSGYVGTVFGNGAYFECSMAFDPALSLHTSVSWPAFWSTAIEFLTGTATRFAELDFFEALPTGTDGIVANVMAGHDWDNIALTNNQNSNRVVSLPSIDFKQQHKYGTWWVPASKNGGTGLLRRYFDGNFVNQFTYSSGAGASPVFTPSNPNGVFSIMDSHNHMVILDCGSGNWPIMVDYVSIWQ